LNLSRHFRSRFLFLTLSPPARNPARDIEHARREAWAPDQQRTTPRNQSASKTRVNALMALRSIRETQTGIAAAPK
jgi:hypothetical protein